MGAPYRAAPKFHLAAGDPFRLQHVQADGGAHDVDYRIQGPDLVKGRLVNIGPVDLGLRFGDPGKNIHRPFLRPRRQTGFFDEAPDFLPPGMAVPTVFVVMMVMVVLVSAVFVAVMSVMMMVVMIMFMPVIVAVPAMFVIMMAVVPVFMTMMFVFAMLMFVIVMVVLVPTVFVAVMSVMMMVVMIMFMPVIVAVPVVFVFMMMMAMGMVTAVAFRFVFVMGKVIRPFPQVHYGVGAGDAPPLVLFKAEVPAPDAEFFQFPP
jgi:hypothetical protein